MLGVKRDAIVDLQKDEGMKALLGSDVGHNLSNVITHLLGVMVQEAEMVTIIN